jgi:hypothetical protein
MISRRAFIGGLAGVLFAAPLAAEAQRLQLYEGRGSPAQR